MIAQILYIILITVGFGMIVGKISDNTYTKEFDGVSAFFGILIVFGLFWWGGLFDQPLNIWGWVLIGWHLFSLGRHISLSGQSKIVTNAGLMMIIALVIEVGLIIGSGFMNPLIH